MDGGGVQTERTQTRLTTMLKILVQQEKRGHLHVCCTFIELSRCSNGANVSYLLYTLLQNWWHEYSRGRHLFPILGMY